MNTPLSWQPLGALLVAKGLLSTPQLEWALSEQRRSGRLLGEILVESGSISAFSLARALTEQHGVELQPVAGESRAPAAETPAAWRPLGKLLVEEGFLTKDELRQALAKQLESRGRRRLGEILVAEGFLSGIELARALAKQNGVSFDPGQEPAVETVLQTAAPGEYVYQVYEVSYEPRYKAHEVLYESASFLEAVDFAAEHIEDSDPDGLEIQRTRGGERETIWTYSDSRAAAAAAARQGLAKTFGFDPTLWGGTAQA
jgi:hypothetical protein